MSGPSARLTVARPSFPRSGEAEGSVCVLARSTLFRAGLASLLASMGMAKVVEAADLQDLSRRTLSEEPAWLLVLEIDGGRGDPAAAVGAAARQFPAARIVAISDELDIQTMSRCFAAGADGFLLKDIQRQALADSLRLVAAGEKVFPSRLAELMRDYAARLAEPELSPDMIRAYRLSAREAEIVRCLVTGDSNKQIARKLGIAEATVKVHVKSILRKTRSSNRTQAALGLLKRDTAGASSVLAAAGSAAPDPDAD